MSVTPATGYPVENCLCSDHVEYHRHDRPGALGQPYGDEEADSDGWSEVVRESTASFLAIEQKRADLAEREVRLYGGA